MMDRKHQPHLGALIVANSHNMDSRASERRFDRMGSDFKGILPSETQDNAYISPKGA